MMPTNCCPSTTRRHCSSTRQRVRWETGVIQSTFLQEGTVAPRHWEININSRAGAEHFHTDTFAMLTVPTASVAVMAPAVLIET